MKLKIKSKIYNIIIANTFKLRLLGLMGKKNISYGMLFPKINSIHTFFMKEDIDVVVLNEENIIIDIKRNMKKNRIYIAKNKAKKTSILELPHNASIDLKIGENLTFISK